MENIIASYNRAEYFVDNLDAPIKIGQINRQIEELLKRSDARFWTFITACNPLSVEFTEKENIVRNENLKKDLMKYRFFEGEGRDSEGVWKPERSFLVPGVTRKAARNLAAKYAQRAIVYGEKGKPAELMETLFPAGNREIIRQNKTAFLCSRKIPAGTVLKCFDWAIEQRERGKCVVSGFHSAIEKDVLHYLLKGSQPVIVVPARGLKKNMEPELRRALEDNRLLIISPFDENIKRVNRTNAVLRNQLMIDIADSVTVGYADAEGSIKRLIDNTDKPLNYV